MMELILASGSPRRKQLLEKSGYTFNTDPIKVSEITKENLSWDGALADLARQKMQAYVDQRNSIELQGKLVLTADTLVIFQDQALGKPKSELQACKYLLALSGQKHCVKTGICLMDISQNKIVTAVDSTEIQFKKLTEDQINKYVVSGEPMDKAGAYGIQGPAREFVEKVSGSFSNVVGLPLELLEKVLKDNNWKIKNVNSK